MFRFNAIPPLAPTIVVRHSLTELFTIAIILKHRTWQEDLQALLCAESLVVADSTLTFFLLAHSKAKRYYLPTVCGPPAGQQRGNSTGGMPQRIQDRDPFNSALLCREKPGAEVNHYIKGGEISSQFEANATMAWIIIIFFICLPKVPCCDVRAAVGIVVYFELSLSMFPSRVVRSIPHEIVHHTRPITRQSVRVYLFFCVRI